MQVLRRRGNRKAKCTVCGKYKRKKEVQESKRRDLGKAAISMVGREERDGCKRKAL